MLKGETLHSPLPWDLPWWAPDHAIFFGVLYAVIGVIGLGLTVVVIKSIIESRKGDEQH